MAHGEVCILHGSLKLDPGGLFQDSMILAPHRIFCPPQGTGTAEHMLWESGHNFSLNSAERFVADCQERREKCKISLVYYR